MRAVSFAVCVLALTVLLHATGVHGVLRAITVDLGTENFKVMKVDKSFDVVLNEASKRYSPTMVGFTHDGVRVLMDDAVSLRGRRPDRVITSPQELLGKRFGDQSVEAIASEHFPFELGEDEERGTYQVVLGEEDSYSAEELVGMILRKTQQMAENVSPTSVKDIVVAVPPYWTHHQRQALINAGKVANVNVLYVLNNGICAAMSFAFLRDLKSESVDQYVMFFDMGAGSTDVSIVHYRTAEDVKKNTTVLNIPVSAYRWDATLGGRDFDRRLALHLEEVATKTLKSYQSTPRSRARLLKEAHRVKHVLNANTEMQVRIENLTPEEDFFYVIKREEFEALCSDLYERALIPVTEAIKDANITVEQLHSVEIIGGGSRMIKLQEMLKDHLKLEELGKHLNGDESIMYGASLIAGTMMMGKQSSKWPYRIRDMSTYAIEVLFPHESENESDEDEIRHMEVYPQGHRLGVKRTYVKKLIRSTDPFQFDVRYAESELLPADAERLIARYNVSGIPQRSEYNYTDMPKIVVTFQLNSNGLVEVLKAEADIVIKRTQLVEKKPEATQEEGRAEEDVEPLNEGDTAGEGESSDEESGEDGATESNAAEDDVGQAEDENAPAAAEVGSDTDDEAAATEAAEEDIEEGSDNDEAEGDQEEPEVESDDAASEPGSDGGEEEAPGDEDEEASGDEDEASDEQGEEGSANDNSTDGEDEAPEEGEPADDIVKEYETKIVKESKRIPLKVDRIEHPLDMTVAQISNSKSVLRRLDREDRERLQKEEDRNELESFSYSVRELVESEYIILASTEEEREELREQAMDVLDWIYDEGEDAPSWEYRKRLRELQGKLEAIRYRLLEVEARPSAAANLRKDFEAWRNDLVNITATKNVTQEELDDVLQSFDEIEQWLTEKEEEQSLLKLHEEPALRSSEIESRLAEMDAKVKVLKRRPKKRKKRKPAVEKNSGDEDAADGEGEGDGEGSNEDVVDEDATGDAGSERQEQDGANEDEPEFTVEIPEAHPEGAGMPPEEEDGGSEVPNGHDEL